MSRETMQIDAKELSDKTLEELQNDLNLDDTFAEDKAKEIHLNNINTKDPNTISSSDQILSYIKSSYSTFSELFTINSSKGEIVDIDPKKDSVLIKIKRENESTYDEIQISKNSKKLSNLLEYNSVNNISELIGQNIFYETRDDENNVYIVPKYLSLLSNTRFKLYYYSKTISNHLDSISNLSSEAFNLPLRVASVMVFFNILFITVRSFNTISIALTIISVFLMLFALSAYISNSVKYVNKIIKGETYDLNVE